MQTLISRHGDCASERLQRCTLLAVVAGTGHKIRFANTVFEWLEAT
jgi:hypothetical protein